MNLCKYKNVLGKPNEGIHSYRFMGISIVDSVITVVAAYFISHKFKKPFGITLLSLFILGIIVHKLFCVRTTIDKVIFRNNAVPSGTK